MITANEVTVQFGQKPLFEEISITFSKGNVYGLIGANGSGKSTFMKVLSSDLEPTTGSVSVQKDRRISMLSQNQFAFEEINIIDCVMMGHKKLWSIKKERDRIYALDDMNEDEALKVSNLEIEFSDMNGYSAESDASELLLGLGISIEEQSLKMKNISPERKLKVLLAQALFGEPDILLLDEPTNNLDIINISWLEETLKDRDSTMVIISHDRHFLNNVCTHMVDLDYGKLQVLVEGDDLTIFSYGQTLHPCLKVASELNKLGQSCRVVNVHTIKPLETEAMIAILEKTKHAVVVEEHNSYGGLGSIVAQIAAEYCPTKINFINTNFT